jgi:DNA-binding NarL/FixJ family response regulator
MIRVVIADDQALMRAGFRLILEAEPDIELAGEAADGAEAVRVTEAISPDVVIMDVRMPGMNGIEATRALTDAGSASRVIMLTTFDMDEYVYDALLAGASGFLLKDSPPEQLIAGIRAACRG